MTGTIFKIDEYEDAVNDDLRARSFNCSVIDC